MPTASRTATPRPIAADALRREHEAIWSAIDEVAARRGISVSRLSILAGNDSTAFNKSKRQIGQTLRFPGGETIARILHVAEMTYGEFGGLVDDRIDANGKSAHGAAEEAKADLPDSPHQE